MKNSIGIICPTATTWTDADGITHPHTIIGCGSTNVHGPDAEGLYDCGDCGIWFRPEAETATANKDTTEQCTTQTTT